MLFTALGRKKENVSFPKLLSFYYFFVGVAEFGNKGSLATKFKKRENKTVISKKVPKVLKVAGDDPDAKMKGYLYFYIKTSSTDWKKHWFVLKHMTLYILRAPEDRIAVDSFVILGYSLEPEYILDVSVLQLGILY